MSSIPTALPTPASADLWREKAQEQRERKAVPLPLPSGMVIQATRPDLEVWTASGLLPDTLTGDIERVFVKSKGEADAIEEAFDEIGEERSSQLLVFMRDAVAAACVSPKIAAVETGMHFVTKARFKGVPLANVEPDPKTGLRLVRPLRGDEIAPEQIPTGDFSFIFGWVLQGCPEVPVKTKGGEVSVSSLRKFHGRRGGSKKPARPRKSRRKVS